MKLPVLSIFELKERGGGWLHNKKQRPVGRLDFFNLARYAGHAQEMHHIWASEYRKHQK
jgi:hypothetical protein